MPVVLLSYGVNILVLLWLVVSLSQGSPSMDMPYGLDTPARRILGCVYGAILLASVAGLGLLGWRGVGHSFVYFTLTLFGLQIVYKVLTAVAVGPSNPVVLANLAISALHAVSMVLLWRMAPG